MNTEEKYWEQLVNGTDFSQKYADVVEIYHLSRLEFDHGKTRRNAVEKSEADIFVMMTQDAVPKNDMLIENLTAPLISQMTERTPNGTVIACVYGRQLPGRDSSPYEKLSRLHNYSELSRTKTGEDIKKLGIKAFFCSDVCCAYRRDIYEECGGFVRSTVFNEDMIMARRFLDKGYAVRYEATAAVIHSHDYSAMEQLRRNFDLGASQAMFPDVFGGISSESEGIKFAVSSIKLLIKKGRPLLVPGFCIQCFFKLVGYRLGKNYASLPNAVIMKLASNKNYWKQMKERH
jgi:rhamnosyltransferase